MQSKEIKVGEEYAVSAHGGYYSRQFATRAQVLEKGLSRFSGGPRNGIRVLLLEDLTHSSAKKGTTLLVASTQVVERWAPYAARRESEQMERERQQQELREAREELARVMRPLQEKLGLSIHTPLDGRTASPVEVAGNMHQKNSGSVSFTLEGFQHLMQAIGLYEPPSPSPQQESSALAELLGGEDASEASVLPPGSE